MKKIVTNLFAICFFYFSGFASTIVITVKNYQFSPSNVNAVVGDVIQWKWQTGTHTTTSKTIPIGAASWDKNITSTTTTYSYTLTVAGTYDYVCTPHQDFGMVGTLNVTGSLPVTLTSFTAAPAKLNTALLAWVTAKEENTSYFAIKRSNDGRNFTEIGRVDAAGNSSLVQRYNFADNNLGTADPYLYYSLDIVDKDGRKESSQIIAFKNNAVISKLIRSISPNPVSLPGHLMLQFWADKAGTLNAKVFSSDGKLVLNQDMGADVGLNNGHIHLGDLMPGVYNIVFTMDGKKETNKIVLQ